MRIKKLRKIFVYSFTLHLQSVSYFVHCFDGLSPVHLFTQSLDVKVYGAAVSHVVIPPHIFVNGFPVEGNVFIAHQKQQQIELLHSQFNLPPILHNGAMGY